jgi:hypothetical protein
LLEILEMSVEVINPSRPIADVWRLPWVAVLAAGIVMALSLWLFWDGLSYMVDLWLNTPEYSHAILIPPIAALFGVAAKGQS